MGSDRPLGDAYWYRIGAGILCDRSVLRYYASRSGLPRSGASSARELTPSFLIRAVQVRLDGLDGQEQPGGGLLVGESGRGQRRDLQLLRRQFVDRGPRPARAQRLAARSQLALGALDPRRAAHALEERERRT